MRSGSNPESVSSPTRTNKSMKYAVLIVLAAFVGCNKKAAPKLPDLEIPPSCTTKILGKQCDTAVNPPKCKTILVDYSPASCAVVHMNSGEKQ